MIVYCLCGGTDKEDSTRFGQLMCQLAAWHVELAAFWRQAHERTDREIQG
jgi:hypothetical protein